MSRITKVKNTLGTSATYVGQEIAAGAYYSIDTLELISWVNDDAVFTAVGDGDLIVNNGADVTDDIASGVAGWLWLTGGDDHPENTDGRTVIHQTSRKLGLITYFTCRGDDQTDGSMIGGDVPEAEKLKWHHAGTEGIGLGNAKYLYLDLNTIDNETHMHEGYVQWKGATNDEVVFEVVPKLTTTTAGTNTNYNLYGGYLITPAAGDGTLVVADADRVLVEVPFDEFGIRAAGYWDATWNTTTKVFDSISANNAGKGQFNMFTVEVTLDRFGNGIPLLGEGFMQLQTSDAAMYGHNMRLRLCIITYGTDHEWWGNAMVTLHRKKTS